mgnify:CR=1 FL=1
MSESNDIANMQESNQQVLNDIKLLQEQEQELYTKLQNKVSSNTITDGEKTQITNKINELYQMRLNLYSVLQETYSSYENNIQNTSNTLKEQKYAVDIIEKQLGIERARLAKLEENKYNKLRMIEFNSSYAAQYQAQTSILKTIAFWCLPIIIAIALNKQGILPDVIANLVVAFSILIGGSIVIYKIIDSLNRDNMNYNEYNWYFNPKNVDTNTSSSDPVDPWDRPKIGQCVGAMCCSDNQTYDADINKCVDNGIAGQESFVNSNLTKYAMASTAAANKKDNIFVNNKIEAFSSGMSNYVSF